MNQTISIIIPVYNRAGLVGRTLRSVEAQTWRPLNVILIDNGSSDGSLEVLKRWKKRVETPDFAVSVLSESRPGACAARNRGLSAADTDWTMFFDSDDLMLPGHVARAMEFVASHPDADIVGWPVSVSFISGKTAIRDFMLRNIVYNNIMHSSFATLRYMARTDLFRKAGGWAEGLAMADDVELGNRLLALNPKVYKVSSRPTVEVYESEVSISNSPDKLSSLAVAMARIAENLPQRRRHWADFQTIILAAAWTRDASEAAPVVEPIMKRTPPVRRVLWRMLYKWTLAGRPGAARLYELLQWAGI